MREGSCHVLTVHGQVTRALGQWREDLAPCPATQRDPSPTACVAHARDVQPDPLVPVPGPVSTRTESDVSWREATGVGGSDYHIPYSVEKLWGHSRTGSILKMGRSRRPRVRPGEPQLWQESPGKGRPSLAPDPRTWRGHGRREEARGRSGPVPGPGLVQPGQRKFPSANPDSARRRCEEVRSHGGTRGRSLSQGAIR